MVELLWPIPWVQVQLTCKLLGPCFWTRWQIISTIHNALQVVLLRKCRSLGYKPSTALRDQIGAGSLKESFFWKKREDIYHCIIHQSGQMIQSQWKWAFASYLGLTMTCFGRLAALVNATSDTCLRCKGCPRCSGLRELDQTSNQFVILHDSSFKPDCYQYLDSLVMPFLFVIYTPKQFLKNR